MSLLVVLAAGRKRALEDRAIEEAKIKMAIANAEARMAIDLAKQGDDITVIAFVDRGNLDLIREKMKMTEDAIRAATMPHQGRPHGKPLQAWQVYQLGHGPW